MFIKTRKTSNIKEFNNSFYATIRPDGKQLINNEHANKK